MESEILQENQTTLQIGNMELDNRTKSLEINSNEVKITWAEFEILHYLAKNSGRVVLRDELFKNVLGLEYNGCDRTIDIRISRLRKRLKNHVDPKKFIKSVRSEGYCLNPVN